MSVRDRAQPPEDGKVFDPAQVDLVSESPSGHRVLLHIVSDASWTGPDAQVDSLQAKIHNYVGFALDGQLVQRYPETEGLPWSIVIDCRRGLPDARTRQLLDRLRDPIRRYGGDLSVSDR